MSRYRSSRLSREARIHARRCRAGGRLHDGVIHRNIFERGINSSQRRGIFRRANSFGDAHERGMRGRKEAAQVFEKCGDAPEEHSRVPEIFSGRHVAPRHGQRGFFSKTANSHKRGCRERLQRATQLRCNHNQFRVAWAERRTPPDCRGRAPDPARLARAGDNAQRRRCSCPTAERPLARRRGRAANELRRGAIAAAVLRPTGSARMCACRNATNSRRTAAACSIFVTTQKLRNAKIGSRRETVSRSMVCRRRYSAVASACACGCAARNECRVRRQAARRRREAIRDLTQSALFTDTPDVTTRPR